MKNTFLLPFAMLALISGCGGTSSALNELKDALSDGGQELVQDVLINEAVEKEKDAIAAIEETKGTGADLLDATKATGVAPVDLQDMDFATIEPGDIILINDEEEGEAVVVKLTGGNSGGEELFILTAEGQSAIIRSSESFKLSQENEQLAAAALEAAATTQDETTISNANVSFNLLTEYASDGDDVLRDKIEIFVLANPGDDEPVVVVSSEKIKTIDPNTAFLFDDYLTVSEAGNRGSFVAPSGTQTYAGTVLLSTRSVNLADKIFALSSENLELSVNFGNSTGSLSASDLTDENGNTGSLVGKFSVINATGSITGEGAANINDISASGPLTGSFDSSADLVGGLLDAGDVTAVFAGKKD